MRVPIVVLKEAAEAAGDYTWKEKVKGAQRATRERNGAPARWYQSGDAQKEYSKTMHKAQLRGAGIGAGLGAIGGAAYGALSKDKAGGRAINTVIPALLGAASGSVIGTTAGTMRAAKPAYDALTSALKQKGLENKGKWRADWNYTPEAEAKYLAPYRK